MNNAQHTALNTYLEPLEKYFAEDGVTEIMINQPGEIIVEKFGATRMVNVKELDFAHLKGLARLIAQSTNQIIDNAHPLLSATLPSGYRVQVVTPPACDAQMIGFAIRKPTQVQMSLEDYEKAGAFDTTITDEGADTSVDEELAKLFKAKKIKEFLKKCVIEKKNLIISGGTSTGKTTFTNAVLQEIPEDERLITVEDAREVVIKQKNKLHLLASKGGQSVAKVTMQDLIEACLRLRPDRIIVGELRGTEAFSFLRAINTGHPGSISTLHADSPAGAVEQLKLMVMQAGLGIPPEQIREYILNVVNLIVQLKRGKGGVRYISEIAFTKNMLKQDKKGS